MWSDLLTLISRSLQVDLESRLSREFAVQNDDSNEHQSLWLTDAKEVRVSRAAQFYGGVRTMGDADRVKYFLISTVCFEGR